MRLIALFALLTFAVAPHLSAAEIVIDFEDLGANQSLTHTNYAGLIWESGNTGYEGNEGFWNIPSSSNNYPSSGDRNVMNAWGCTLIGIAFPEQVDVLGAYFAGQGVDYCWTTGVRVHGYRDGSLVETTDWFTDIDTSPDWFAIDLFDVDRIVIESIPVIQGGGWYGMDDLTYSTAIPEPASLGLLALGAMIAVRRRT